MQEIKIESGNTVCREGKRVRFEDRYRLVHGDGQILARWLIERRFWCAVAVEASSNYSEELKAQRIVEGQLCENCEMMKEPQ